MITNGQETILQAKNLSKTFPGVLALDQVSLEIRAGEVHALMGENGAGKSTLMRILAGLERADTGDILVRNLPANIRDPHTALRLGIAMIHQELMPFPHLSVAENIFVGHEPARGPLAWINRRSMIRQAQAVLDRLCLQIAPNQPMRTLSVAGMQTVEIARALVQNARILIMDEPTSAVSDREVDALFQIIFDLRREGVAVIYISHKMEEVFRIADRITVLRDGRHITTLERQSVTPAGVIEMMVGRELARKRGMHTEITNVQTGSSKPPALAVRGLRRAARFRDITFELRRGEILGVAGLMGAGRTDLLNSLYGMPPAETGEIRVHGAPVRITCPADALACGIALVTEDRKHNGLVLQMSVKENLTLSNLKRCCRGWFISGRREKAVAEDQVRRFSIKTRDTAQPVNCLSGGNQQKVVLARALLNQPEILLLDEPTRGIDIGAKAEVQSLIAHMAREGKAVLVVSSELPELLSLCHRILVMRQGMIAAEFNPHVATPHEILAHAMPS